jgi:hypothetical protein
MKQIGGLCYPLVKTIDDLVFYKLGDEYYARKKSTLSSERVKTSPEFRRTMVHADLLKRASKIGAAVYNALPPGWRQFWMYRSFTGEAFILLQDNPYTDEEVKQLLWQCYVEYWEQRKLIDPDNLIFQPKPKKIRKRRKYSEESIKRLLKRKDKHGRPRYIDFEEEERKRQHKAMNRACYERTMEKYRRLAEEQLLAEEKLRVAQGCVEHWAKAQEGDRNFYPGPKGPGNSEREKVLEQGDKAVPALLVRRAEGPGIVMRGCKPRIAKTRLLRWGQRPHNSLARRRRASEESLIPQLAGRRASNYFIPFSPSLISLLHPSHSRVNKLLLVRSANSPPHILHNPANLLQLT